MLRAICIQKYTAVKVTQLKYMRTLHGSQFAARRWQCAQMRCKGKHAGQKVGQHSLDVWPVPPRRDAPSRFAGLLRALLVKRCFPEHIVRRCSMHSKQAINRNGKTATGSGGMQECRMLLNKAAEQEKLGMRLARSGHQGWLPGLCITQS